MDPEVPPVTPGGTSANEGPGTSSLPDSVLSTAGPGGPKEHSALRVIGRGFSWVTGLQVITAAVNLVLTPFIIHGLGIERYGLYLLTTSIGSLLGGFNGGLGATASRYFPIYAGTDDRVATTRLLVTFLAIVAGVAVVISVADWFVSPVIVDALKMSPSLRPESVFLFRTIGILIALSLGHSLMQSVIMARQRFDRVVQASLVCYSLWVFGLILVVHYHWGLRGVAVVSLAQQAVAMVAIGWTSLQYLTRKGFSLLAWDEVKPLMSFAAKMQVTGFAGLINNQIDTLAVGAGLSVRTVGIYNSGNSFAGQFSSIVGNAVAPAAIQLGNTYGKHGPERTFQQFSRIQRSWVAAVTGWTAVGMGASYFAVTAWLGPEFKLGGWVGVVVVGGGLFSASAALMLSYITVLRQAGLEMRYGLVQMAANLVFTLPMIWVSALAVAIGASAAQVLSAAFLMRLVRKRVRPDMPDFFRQIPVLRGAVAAAVTVAGEVVVRPFIVVGALGLLECIPPAVIGLAVFGLLYVGPRRSASFVREVVRTKRLPKLSSLRDGQG